MCDIAKLKIHRKCTSPAEEPAIVYIVTDAGNVGLCEKCWGKVADSDLEWGPDPRPTVEEIFGRRAKEEAEATPTEYKPKSDKKTDQEKEEEEY